MELTKVACGECGHEIDEPANTPVEQRAPCPNPDCGSKSRKFFIEGTSLVRAQVGLRGRGQKERGQGGKKRLWIEFLSEASWSYRFRKWMHRSKIEYRRNDSYVEIVTDPDTNVVIHENREPLSKHRGHGSARSNKP